MSKSTACIPLLKALADETRRRIVQELVTETLTVTELTERLQVTQYSGSKHLRILREAGIIRTEKQGKHLKCCVEEEFRLQVSRSKNQLDLALPNQNQINRKTMFRPMKTTQRSFCQFAQRVPVLTIAAVLATFAGTLAAETIAVPNGSFESPTPPPGFPASPQVDVWQKTPQPPQVPLPGGITWDQLSGVFPNTAPVEPNHIGNMTGNQAAYLFAIPGVGLFQQLNATFQIGQSYNLTLGMLGGGGIAEGSSFLMSLYYLDGGNSQVTLGATPITYTAAGFSNPTHLYDYTATVGEVQAGDAWAGQRIGIQLLSTFGTGQGYWDVDNVRLMSVPEPSTVGLLALGAGGWLAARLRSRRRM